MTFLNPWAFLLIFIAFWLFKDILFLRHNTQFSAFATEHKHYILQTKLILLSLLLALLALARPAFTNEISKEKFDANEYIIALDASYSMSLDDVKPSRYQIAKRTIVELLQADAKNRFSLFAFTTNPLLICPPTTDHAIAISALDALSPEYILTKGTSIESLLEKIATLPMVHKSLIIFSDGGDEHNLKSLLLFAKKNAITINILAIASNKGAVVIKDNQPLKDEEQHLIISRINPILKDLARGSGGFYFELQDAHTTLIEEIHAKLQAQNLQAKELSTDIVSYREFYFIPLLLAFILLIISLTKVQKLIPILSILFLLTPLSRLEASLLDFYYIKEAQKAYNDKEYVEARDYFSKLSPSQYSYMSIANSYYKNKQFRDSLRYYSQIKSTNPHVKSTLFYNMANAAFMLKKYQRAENLYKQSLALEYSKEAYENLLLIVKYKLVAKVNVADMLPTKDDKTVKNITKKNDTKNNEKESAGSSSSQQKTNQGSQGGGDTKSKEKAKKSTQSQNKKNNYKMGYNAYEVMNKGYINEKHPW